MPEPTTTHISSKEADLSLHTYTYVLLQTIFWNINCWLRTNDNLIPLNGCYDIMAYLKQVLSLSFLLQVPHTVNSAEAKVHLTLSWPAGHTCPAGHKRVNGDYTESNNRTKINKWKQCRHKLLWLKFMYYHGITQDVMNRATEQSPSWETNQFSASQEIPRLCGTRRFNTAFTKARQLSLSWARPVQSVPPIPHLENPSEYYPRIHLWNRTMFNFVFTALKRAVTQSIDNTNADKMREQLRPQ